MEPDWDNWDGQGDRQRYQDPRNSPYHSVRPEDYGHSPYPPIPLIPQPEYVGQAFTRQEISPAFPALATSTQYTQHPHRHPEYPSHSSSYLAPDYGSAYHNSPHYSGANSPALSSHASSTHADTPSPRPLDDFQDENQSIDHLDPDIVRIFYPNAVSSGSGSHAGPSHSSSSTPSRFQQSQTAYHMCDHPGCNKICPRLCDLRKHKKRHQKPFPCREGEACGSYFSTEKDRDRHERSKHRVEERLTCAVCGHRTARKDNMKDHVRRRHGEKDLERIMDITMGMMAG